MEVALELSERRGRKTFEAPRQSLDCHEGTSGRNMGVEYDSGECSEKRRVGEESIHLFREYVNNCVQIVGRPMNVKGDSGEVSDGNKDQVIENWSKSDPCFKVANNFVELCSTGLWKVELASNKIEYLAEISK